MRKNYFYIIQIAIALLTLACSEEEKTDSQIVGSPIEMDFRFGDQGAETRGNTVLDWVGRTVYVTSDGVTYYTYVYDSNSSRWVVQGENKLTWTDAEMQLYAFVRYDDEPFDQNHKTIGISSAQSSGYESSDFLACGGTYTLSSGVVTMVLKHKVAKLVVNISGCLDASQMSCSTTSALPTQADVNFTAGNVTLSNVTSTTGQINMFRSEYSVTNKTATFVSYVLPQSSFDGKFDVGCGNLKFKVTASSIQLNEGQTSVVNINMPTDIELVTDFDYTGEIQTFTPKVTGNYLLEVWGAQGGCYDYIANPWTDYDKQMLGIGLCEGGKGAYVRGIAQLNKGEPLYVHVGGQGTGSVANGTKVSDTGTTGSYTPTTGATSVNYTYYIYQLSGGWNGGGSVYLYDQLAVQTSAVGATPVTNAPRQQGGGGGGGATDISYNKSSTNNKTWRDDAHLNSRIIVAGGGGGGCYVPTQKGWYTGGYGGGGASWEGGTGAGDGNSRGFGGTLTTFGPHGQGSAVGNIRTISNVESYDIININTGSAIPLDGGFGYGGSGRWTADGGESLGAGGGGWYGGGCANGTGSNGAGGGGSSYAYSDEQKSAYNGKTLDQYWPSGITAPDTKYLLKDVSNRINEKEGNGKARITLLLE